MLVCSILSLPRPAAQQVKPPRTTSEPPLPCHFENQGPLQQPCDLCWTAAQQALVTVPRPYAMKSVQVFVRTPGFFIEN
jgi:hypothetical protein